MQQFPYHTADEQPTVFTNGSNAVLNTAESAQTAHNSDYAAALRVYEEYLANGEYAYGSAFATFCRERLNPPKAADCA